MSRRSPSDTARRLSCQDGAGPPAGAVTKLPPARPRRVSTSPRCRRATSASRTVTVDTPNCAASSASLGRRSASARSPSVMASASRAVTASARPSWSSGANIADRAPCDIPCDIPLRITYSILPDRIAILHMNLYVFTMTPAVALRGLRKDFGAITAVDGVDLDVPAGEYFAMHGPSGSGKTTVLRLIAGFELPTAGTVELDGRDVGALPPFDRDVNTVFQDYALFPHMSVRENVEYGLRVKRVPRTERRLRAGDALATVRLEGYGERKPTHLSCGA